MRKIQTTSQKKNDGKIQKDYSKKSKREWLIIMPNLASNQKCKRELLWGRPSPIKLQKLESAHGKPSFVKDLDEQELFDVLILGVQVGTTTL